MMVGRDGGRILVVDDNRLNRVKLQHDLHRQGFEVRQAEHGQQALELLRAEAYDVVLLDILMPVLDGYQTLAEMKRDAALRDVPVIVISALDEVESAVRCIEMGAEDYLTKPFNPTLLRARLGASLRAKRLRDLERAYLQQELVLRQQEKLATLGKLSAGLAHELNNPAADAARGRAAARRPGLAAARAPGRRGGRIRRSRSGAAAHAGGAGRRTGADAGVPERAGALGSRGGR